MRTIAIPQLYCGASGKKGAYNRQEVGLARAFAALGCRAVVLYPDPDAAPEAVTSEDLEPNVRIYYVPLHSAPAGIQYGRFAGVDEYTTKESNRLTRLPLYYGLTEADRAAVVQVVKDFFAQK